MREIIKERPYAFIDFGNLIDEWGALRSDYFIHYTCHGCGRTINEKDIACDRCGTFHDWSKRAKIVIKRELVWEGEE